MAILGDKLKIIVRGLIYNQQWENVQWYRPTGTAFALVDAGAVAEAYWNNVKDLWRAIVPSSAGMTFESVFVAEPGATGAYGEFSVPVGEKDGTRTAGVGGQGLMPFAAVGMRLTVATRTTRPGQKRFIGLTEGDNVNGILGVDMIAAVEALSVKFDSTIALGVPVATGVLDPIICRIDRATGDVTASQLVTGHVINSNITSQNSRKYGRGV